MKISFQILFITLLLSACSNSSVKDATPLLVSPTATFSNTDAPQPSSEQTLLATVTPLAEKFIAITETRTVELSVKETVAAFGTICQSPANAPKISPDGRWIAMECEGVDKGVDDPYLQVVSIQGDKKWTLHYADYANGTYYDRWNTIRAARWSADGKYLYATSESTGSGCCWIGWNVLLVRLNLENGQQTTIANYIDKVPGMDISLSPSERYILYIPQDGRNNLYIWDTQSTEQRVIKLEETRAGAGHTLMSNDDQKIILVLQDYPKEDQGLPFSSLVLIDLKSGSQKILLSGIDYLETPIPVSWKDEDHVLLQKESELLLLNINTGELTKAEKP